MYMPKHLIVAAVLFVGAAIPVAAQQPAAPPPPPTMAYGSPIGLEAAKKAMAAAEAEAVKNNWPMAIVILDSTGHVVMLRTLALRGATPLEGGIPIVADGKIIGAIGVSGGTAPQDGQVAKVGADAAAK